MFLIKKNRPQKNRFHVFSVSWHHFGKLNWSSEWNTILLCDFCGRLYIILPTNNRSTTFLARDSNNGENKEDWKIPRHGDDETEGTWRGGRRKIETSRTKSESSGTTCANYFAKQFLAVVAGIAKSLDRYDTGSIESLQCRGTMAPIQTPVSDVATSWMDGSMPRRKRNVRSSARYAVAKTCSSKNIGQKEKRTWTRPCLRGFESIKTRAS